MQPICRVLLDIGAIIDAIYHLYRSVAMVSFSYRLGIAEDGYQTRTMNLIDEYGLQQLFCAKV